LTKIIKRCNLSKIQIITGYSSMEKIKTRLFSILLFILVAGYLCFPLSASAEKMTHIVKKGDTLWDICEHYYGDSSLWPKLWEMNSFITNPHLLTPGDVITLFEKTPQKAPEPAPEPEPVMGINIEDIIQNTNKIGFYTSGKDTLWGTLYGAADKHLILGINNIVYVIFEDGKKVSIGSEFAIGKLTPVKHPVTKKKAGYIFDVSGRLVIEKKAGIEYRGDQTYDKANSYQAKIIESYEPVEIGDILMPPSNSVSKCILPIPNNRDILANIVAGSNEQTLIHKYSVIYMDKGHDAGVKKGNIFEIRMGNRVKDPKPEKTLTWREEQVILPDRVLGRILVIDTYPDSAIGLVLSATEPVAPGAYLKNVSWTETPDFKLNKANCPIE
jgi:LysM repeat protein